MKIACFTPRPFSRSCGLEVSLRRGQWRAGVFFDRMPDWFCYLPAERMHPSAARPGAWQLRVWRLALAWRPTR